MARLPIPGSDKGTWGNVLNAFLAIAHNSDGTLKSNSVGSSALQNGSVTASKLAASVPIVLVYDTGSSSYPPRPTGTAAGYVTYKGPVAPTDAQQPDTWEDTSGIWP